MGEWEGNAQGRNSDPQQGEARWEPRGLASGKWKAYFLGQGLT